MLLTSKACAKYAQRYDREAAVVGVGGGRVIDEAKILATLLGKPCIAVPTTASGAACTSHAVVWGKEHYRVPTVRPEVIMPDFPIELHPKVLEATLYDCYCHILESEWSEKATLESIWYCAMAKARIAAFLKDKNIIALISAGNCAGAAIDITGTNIIHELSYPLTIKGMPHGLALKEVLNAVK